MGKICESMVPFEDDGQKKKTENENETILVYSGILIIENLLLVTHVLLDIIKGWLSIS